MKIAFINGINGNGSRSTDLLCKELKDRGHDTVEVNYPHTRFWNAGSRKVQLDRARILYEATSDGYNLAAHSFGCIIGRRTMQLGRNFKEVFFFGSADESDTYYPDGSADNIHVIYNPYDTVLWWSNILPNHDFGDMGRVGYQGRDKNVKSVRSQYYRIAKNRHGFYFHGSELCKWADYIEATTNEV